MVVKSTVVINNSGSFVGVVVIRGSIDGVVVVEAVLVGEALSMG